MFFTQEDYRKIEKWLLQRTVKDSDLPSTDPLNGSERVSVIQGGRNKILSLNDFVKQVADMRLPDFYNITANTRRFNLCLSEAINLVPVKQRKVGFTITFHSKKGNWVIYQFSGTSLNQWSSISCWHNIIDQAIKEALIYPDEEDITGVVSDGKTVLKFKDKEYNPDEFSGKGIVILRKNITATEACHIDDEDHYINKLTQEMVSQENTIYIVQYDFDLNGQLLQIPANSVLYFNGGTINNGTITLTGTAILGVLDWRNLGSGVTILGDPAIGQTTVFTKIDPINPVVLSWFDGVKWIETATRDEIERLSDRISALERAI